MTEPTHTPLPYECFQDRSYYDMWCVRRVNEREWGKGFHLVNGEEAAALRDMLNTRADSHHRLVGVRNALRAFHDGKLSRSETIAKIDAALKEAGRG